MKVHILPRCLAVIVLLALLVAPTLSDAAPMTQGPTSLGAGDESVETQSPTIIIRAIPRDPNTPPAFIPPNPRLRLNPAAVANATFNVAWNGAWTPDAQAAFQYALAIWASLLDSPVPIDVNANWTDLGSTGILGSAGATSSHRDFANSPAANTWVANALADRRSCTDIGANQYEINASFNSTFADWYLGTDGATPSNKWDFVTVVLHEIGHGIGFFGSMSVSGGTGSWGSSGFPWIYDRFVEDPSLVSLLNTVTYPNPSTALGTRLTEGVGAVQWKGVFGIAGNGGLKPILYTPTTWQSGSSYSHFDQSSYPNELMRPALPNGVAIHSPGDRTMGVLRDIGWGQELVIEAFGYETSSARPEWVQIKNVSPIAVNLGDYAIGDEERQGGSEGMYMLPNISLAAGSILLMRVRDDGAWTYSKPNPTYCWNCASGYTNLTSYSTWGTGLGNLDNAGDEIVLLRTNGGASDTDGTIDDTLVDAVCYGSGQTYVDTDGSGAKNGRDPYIFTSGTCMSDITSGSYKRASSATTCVAASAWADNPTLVALGSFEAEPAQVPKNVMPVIGWVAPLAALCLLGGVGILRRTRR